MKELIKIHAIIKCKYSYVKLLHKVFAEHSHDCFQVIYVVHGNGFISLSGDKVAIKKNDILMINPNVQHMSFCKDGVMTTYELKFHALDSDTYNTLLTLPMIIVDKDDAVLSVFKRIMSESKQKHPYWIEILQQNIMEMIYSIRRLLITFEGEPNNNEKDEDVMLVDENNKVVIAAKYIEQNYDKQIYLKDLADIMMLSAAHFSREFTKHFNKSPIKYLHDIRLQKAKEFLKHSDYSVTEISQMTGFSSVHYFSRYFTKHEGCSPLKYKELFNDEYAIFL